VRRYGFEFDECIVECETAGGEVRLHRPGCRYIALTIGRKWFKQDGFVITSTDPGLVAASLCSSCIPDPRGRQVVEYL
jgi:hypothetical protein